MTIGKDVTPQPEFLPTEGKTRADRMSSKITSIHWTQPTESQSIWLAHVFGGLSSSEDVGIPCFSTGVSAEELGVFSISIFQYFPRLPLVI